MTLVSQIVIDGYRQSNLTPIGVALTVSQETEGLRYLNRIVKSVLGNEVGDPLTGIPIGRRNRSRPSGFPWWNTVPDNDWFVPKNSRLNLNLETTGINIYLHPEPDDGSRFAVVDASNNLATYPITVYGNGAFIESAASIVLNTSGLEREWFYRADLGEWKRYSPLTLFDTFPFPEEFEDYFVLLLAFRLNPAYERQLDSQSAEVLQRSRNQIRARYKQNVEAPAETGLVRLSELAADRDNWHNYDNVSDPNSRFLKGWPW